MDSSHEFLGFGKTNLANTWTLATQILLVSVGFPQESTPRVSFCCRRVTGQLSSFMSKIEISLASQGFSLSKLQLSRLCFRLTPPWLLKTRCSVSFCSLWSFPSDRGTCLSHCNLPARPQSWFTLEDQQLQLGPPVVPFYLFFWEDSPTKTDYRKKMGTRILTSNYWRT